MASSPTDKTSNVSTSSTTANDTPKKSDDTKDTQTVNNSSSSTNTIDNTTAPTNSSNSAILNDVTTGPYRWKSNTELTNIVMVGRKLVNLRKEIDENRNICPSNPILTGLYKSHAETLVQLITDTLKVGTNDAFNLLKNFMDDNHVVFSPNNIFVDIYTLPLQVKQRESVITVTTQFIAIINNYTAQLQPNYYSIFAKTQNSAFSLYMVNALYKHQETAFKFDR